MRYTSTISSLLGPMVLASDGTHLTGLWFEGQAHFGSTLPEETASSSLPLFEAAEQWLADYFTDKQPANTLPLLPEGTPYRQEIWSLLGEIPYGNTVSYKELAQQYLEKTGRKTSPRAVGGAVGHNPISILIPCHRVVGSDGSLTGYAGGVHRKQQLLSLEGIL